MFRDREVPPSRFEELPRLRFELADLKLLDRNLAISKNGASTTSPASCLIRPIWSAKPGQTALFWCRPGTKTSIVHRSSAFKLRFPPVFIEKTMAQVLRSTIAMRPLVTLIGAGPGEHVRSGTKVIEVGKRSDQRQLVTTLAGLRSEGFAGPALLVIGDVVRFARVAARQAHARTA